MTLKVLIRPAWRGTNGYTAMFADSLVENGIDVRDLENAAASSQPADVVILHWPDEFFFRSTWKQLVRSQWILLQFLRAKLVQGKKLVWVAHNLVPHVRRPRPSRIRLGTFLRAVDGLIFLSDTSQAQFYEVYPRLASRPFVVVPHGHYRPVELTLPQLPRPILGRPPRLAFIGQIKRYKGPAELARVAAAMPDGALELTLTGRCTDGPLADELRAIASDHGRIKPTFDFLDDAALERTVDDADAIILPYRQILNSGSALFALSRFRPVIAPRLGSLIELEREVGAHWLHLYEGELTPETLAAALDWVRLPRPSPPDLSSQDWSGIGKRLADFLRALVKGQSHRS